jgi:hypothetical protein
MAEDQDDQTTDEGDEKQGSPIDLASTAKAAAIGGAAGAAAGAAIEAGRGLLRERSGADESEDDGGDEQEE